MQSKTNRCFIQIFLGLLFCSSGYAQTPVSGLVTEAATGKPMAGVNIVIKNTIAGTTTDAAGRFTLTIRQVPATLVFSYVG